MKMSAQAIGWLALAATVGMGPANLLGQKPESPIRFELKELPFRLNSDESQSRNAPETMAGGVAVFDYDGDGRPDIFFANGAHTSNRCMTYSASRVSNATGNRFRMV